MEQKPARKISDVTPFARTNYHNTQRVFGIKTDDRRRHVYVIGKTGMGKSTLLENFVFSDIQNGNGVCYVDPHGDTAEKILQWIPEHRIKDVIYFNPADLEFPIAFNVLEKVAPKYRNLIASGLVSVYKKLWADSWGPRLEYILRYCILALLDSPDSTLLGINRMLVDPAYRSYVLSTVEDPVVKSFWVDEFSKWNDRVLAEVISPIQNKVGQFLSNSMIRNIVGQQESTLALRDIMDSKKILILNLSKGRMGEDASALLGAMMITKLQLAAMTRVDILEEERKDFYLYVDEFQNFATESFANILSEARKYRLCLTVAHQYIAQLTDQMNTVVRDAVFGNVGTMIAFRVGATDAEFLEKEFTPQFLLEDLINLPKFKIYLRLMVDGVSTDPFSADALPPLSSKDLGNSQKVIAYTRASYTRPRLEVMNSINTWAVKDFTGFAAEPGGFHAGPTPSQAYSAEKAKREEKEVKPIVWHGNCDVCGKVLDLSFTPDESRPVLCQDDLKLFRKGGLPGPKVESMMMKVMDRKKAIQNAAKPVQAMTLTKPVPKAVPSAPAAPKSPSTTQSTPRPASPAHQSSRPSSPTHASVKPAATRPPMVNKPSVPVAPVAKGTIRLVTEFSDEKKRAEEKAESKPVTPETKVEKQFDSTPTFFAKGQAGILGAEDDEADVLPVPAAVKPQSPKVEPVQQPKEEPASTPAQSGGQQLKPGEKIEF